MGIGPPARMIFLIFQKKNLSFWFFSKILFKRRSLSHSLSFETSVVEIGWELFEIIDFGYISETRHEKPEDLLFSSHSEKKWRINKTLLQEVYGIIVDMLANFYSILSRTFGDMIKNTFLKCPKILILSSHFPIFFKN